MNSQDFSRWLDEHGDGDLKRRTDEPDDPDARPIVEFPQPDITLPDMPDVHVPRPSVNITNITQSTVGHLLKHFVVPIGGAYLVMQAIFGTMPIWGYLPGFAVLFSTLIFSGWILNMLGVLTVANKNFLGGMDLIIYGVVLMMVPGLFYTHYLHLNRNYENLTRHEKTAHAMGLEKAYDRKKADLEKRLQWWDKRFKAMSTTLQQWEDQQRVEALTYSDEELQNELVEPPQTEAPKLPESLREQARQPEQTDNPPTLPGTVNELPSPPPDTPKAPAPSVPERLSEQVFGPFSQTPEQLQERLDRRGVSSDRAVDDGTRMFLYRLYDRAALDEHLDQLTDEQRSALKDALPKRKEAR